MESQVQVYKAPESSINAVAIRESSLGQYLESINTGGTWLTTVQETLGLPKVEFSALDAMYTAAGALGFGILVVAGPVSIPVVVGSSALIGVAAVGLSEEDRRAKIGTGIAAGALTITNPQAVVYVAKEAYGATKETIKQTVELAKTAAGMTTSAIGFGTAALGTYVIIVKNRKTNKRKRVS